MRSFIIAAAAAFTLAPLTVLAQTSVAMDPIEAKQCAVWASYVSSAIEDEPETQQALLFAVNYFVGQYEGVTGTSIAAEPDTEAMIAVAEDLQRFTTLCAGHMEGFGARMSAWGEILTRLGEEGSAAGE